jgi:hypothetical protein
MRICQILIRLPEQESASPAPDTSLHPQAETDSESQRDSPPFRFASNPFQKCTDFTLTTGCLTDIIILRHYPLYIGVQNDNT